MRALAPCSCQSLPLARTAGQALGPRLRGDDEQGGVPNANFCNEVLAHQLTADDAQNCSEHQSKRAVGYTNCCIATHQYPRYGTDEQ